MKILGIETSCDETAVAILEIQASTFKIVSNVVSSQVQTHAKYGGVVPEVAARKHAENIMPVIIEALKDVLPSQILFTRRKFQRNLGGQAKTWGSKSAFNNTLTGVNPNGVAPVRTRQTTKSAASEINAIAVTQGPGLITSLRVGAEAARTLSCVWNKPLIPINHVIAHIYSNWLTPIREIRNPKSEIRNKSQILNSKFPNINFPALCLVVSGGHTLLVLMKNHGKFEIVGQTLDDAAGECFDKTAKILGLGYPGGPAIARQAEQWKSAQTSVGVSASLRKSKIYNLKSNIQLPRPMLNSNDFNFSFSGLKTAVLYKMRDMKSASCGIGADMSAEVLTKAEGTRRFTASIFINQMAYEIQNAIIDVLVAKTIRAAKKYNAKTIMLGGGVAANKELRKRFQEEIQNLKQPPHSPPVPRQVGEQGEIEGVKKQNLTITNQQLKLFMPETSYCTDNAAMIAIAAYFNPKKISWKDFEPDPNLMIK